MIDFSYDAILQRLKDNLSKNLDNSNMLFYSTNQRILEAIAEELTEEARYNEYLTQESKWSAAQNISSIMSQLDFFNYKAHLKIGASGYLKVSTNPQLNGTYTFRVVIPKFSQFSNGDLFFTTTKTMSIYPNDHFIMIPIIQGFKQTETFEITDSDLESTNVSLSVYNEFFENTLFEVKVNGIQWTEAHFFLESTSPESTIFITKPENDFSGMRFYFGDGQTSKALELGDTVEIIFLETKGNEGEVLSLNNITKVTDSFIDTNGAFINIYCSNVATETDTGLITGGKDIEDLNSIRKNAPFTFKVGSRIISTDDYYSVINNTNIPSKLLVWGEKEINEQNNQPAGTFIPLSENEVYVTALTINNATGRAELLNQEQKESIRSEVSEFKGLTDILSFVDPKVTYIVFESMIYYIQTAITSSEVQANVVIALEKAYNIENTEFFQNLFFSQYYALINNVEGVDYHETSIFLFQLTNFNETLGSTFTFQLNLLHNDIRPTIDINNPNFKIYIKSLDETIDPSHPYADWFPIAYDDGVGNIISYDVPDYSGIPDFGSTFDIVTTTTANFYSAGFIDILTINKGIPDNWQSNLQIKIEFRTGSVTEIIPRERYQIYALFSETITTQGKV